MKLRMGKGNKISKSANIDENVVMGNFNNIGENVVISSFKGSSISKIYIGDCNNIHDNTRILIGKKGLSIGDWNVFHNNMLVMGQERMEIGHNCWFGQNTILDSAGGLYIGNGVRVGMYSQIWTHVASGELIEGCTLHAMRPTYIEDEVWLVGSCIVGSGLRLRRRSMALIGSLLSRDTEEGKVYGGVPAKELDNLCFWKTVSPLEKMQMMLNWVKEFIDQSNDSTEFEYESGQDYIHLKSNSSGESLAIVSEMDTSAHDKDTSYFDLASKTYTKKLTLLERQFYSFIYDHKARFIPA